MDPVLADLLVQAIALALLISLPPALSAVIAGLATNVLATLTQIHDPSLSHLARVLAAFGALVLAAPWIGQTMIAFATRLMQALPTV